ncbi:sigma-w pathway protein ysdB [Salinibacillus xinjiangensis]|uniref:Sigma-w pathway protein ysdB n=1 Tax=Salinibacillus xinjiangensis TaxID=1229268 RepID=A0A6G1X9N0_9BACI|nr:sigma-w pathway protein ysdB [Salinibacillus xinjiangensis]MRG87652.1 sigma-w pathway protein ysdB [Salinibacillus xinjiangensis]
MVVILFRLLIIFAIIFFIYSAYKYIVNPKRKLEIAQENKTFYFYDDENNVKKNFLITYKGALFEGEKYLGTTEQAFEVVTITVWTKHPDLLKGISREDLYFIEKEILIKYPHAKIEWRHPIKNIFCD